MVCMESVVCVFLNESATNVRRSSSAASTTLRSPAPERPVCLSSSLGLSWVSDGNGEAGPHRRRRPQRRTARRRLLFRPMNAARCARCFRPHRSVG